MPENTRTVLISTVGDILAHVGRSILVGKALRDHGFHVLFSGKGRYFRLVEQEDFEVISLESVDTQHMLTQARRKMAGVNVITAEGFDHLVQLSLKLLDKLQPDVVLHDLQPSIAVAASLTGTPCVSIVNAYLTKYSQTPLETVIFHPLLRPFLEPIRRRMASKPFRALASKYDLPRNAVFKDMLTIADLVLLPDIPEFVPTRNLPSHFKYCGPLVWEPGNGSTSALKELNPNRPRVYFTLGSTGLPEMFYSVMNDLGETEYQVIMTTGSQLDLEEMGRLPGNFMVKTFFPGSVVLKYSDVMICHGGNGTIYQALAAGRPILAIPTHLDQRASAHLMKKQGAGLVILPSQMENLLPSLERLFDDPSYQENSRRMQKLLSRLDGAQTAASLIMDHLEMSSQRGV
jgi:MGT family glycosyltransferase